MAGGYVCGVGFSVAIQRVRSGFDFLIDTIHGTGLYLSKADIPGLGAEYCICKLWKEDGLTATRLCGSWGITVA